jgi:hypothetical protein
MSCGVPELDLWFENAYSISSVISIHVPHTPKKKGGDYVKQLPTPSDEEKLLIVGRDIFSLPSDSTFDDIQSKFLLSFIIENY